MRKQPRSFALQSKIGFLAGRKQRLASAKIQNIQTLDLYTVFCFMATKKHPLRKQPWLRIHTTYRKALLPVHATATEAATDARTGQQLEKGGSNLRSVTLFAEVALEKRAPEELDTKSLYQEYCRYCRDELQLGEIPVKNISFTRTLLAYFATEEGPLVTKATTRTGTKLVNIKYSSKYLLKHEHLALNTPRAGQKSYAVRESARLMKELDLLRQKQERLEKEKDLLQAPVYTKFMKQLESKMSLVREQLNDLELPTE